MKRLSRDTLFPMRLAVVAGLLALCLAAAQAAPSQPEPVRPPNASTLTVRVEPQPPRAPSSSFAEYVGAIAVLAQALAWPLLFGILVVTQRRSLERLVGALIDVIQYSHHLKLGNMIDVEVDRSAKEAQSREAPAVEVTPKEIETAARVGRMAESSDPSAIRGRMLEFAREYEATRSSMKPGPERTRAMNAIAAKMRTLAIAATPFLHELAHDEDSPGKRLAALAILQLAPDLSYLDWLVERMSREQPFLLFHASLALLAMVRYFGARSRKDLETAVQKSLAIVQSFKGGPPDRNTVETLQIAQAELRSTGRAGPEVGHPGG